MKLFSMISMLVFTLTAGAQSKVLFQCVDGSRSFTVKRSADGEYTGTFKDFSGLLKKYDCQRTGRGYNFKCTKDEYIVTVRRSAQGGMMVDFELAGDFFPDSGYLYSLSCEDN